MPTRPAGGGTDLRQAAKEEARGLDEHDAEAKGEEQLVLVRTAVEGSDHDPLHHHADEHDEQGTGDDGDDERAAVGVGDPAGVAAEHEHRAVRQIEDAERAVNDRQAGGDQREERAEHQPVEALRYEIRPVDHVVARLGEDRVPTLWPASTRPAMPNPSRRYGRHDGVNAPSAPRRAERAVSVRCNRRACSRRRRVSA